VGILHSYSKLCEAGFSPLKLVFASRRSNRDQERLSTPVSRALQLREDEIDRLVARFKETGSVKDVAVEFGISRQTAAKHIKQRGLLTVNRMKEEQILEAAERYLDGASAKTIGLALGFDTQTILRGLRSVGVPIRPRSGWEPR
jgi:AraC-like DNA-binding protein